MSPLSTPVIHPSSSYNTLDVEFAQSYGKDKHHPLPLFTTLSSRFKILHKLDHSRSRLSYLVRDLVQNTYRRLDTTLAINYSSESSFVSRQLTFRARLSPQEADLEGLALGSFDIDGPNGKHLAILYPLNGCWGSFRLHCTEQNEVELNEEFFWGEHCKIRGPAGGIAGGGFHGMPEEDFYRILGRPEMVEFAHGLFQRPGEGRECYPEYLVVRPRVNVIGSRRGRVRGTRAR
ncbi:hypothetical protein QBC40DRAFT_313852 [Triangularia verruculosa]|uniref:Uncharacterized protein n=1 Tax=Triangularia verruculosa TaxID=2587418 RepID=A0AAN6XEJ1_9PEZI|nr:hypothetical protein QBC40DRAFT_313852 [Triangularia verruculosa]